MNTELQLMKTSVKEEDRTSTALKSIALHIEFKSWPSHLQIMWLWALHALEIILKMKKMNQLLHRVTENKITPISKRIKL